MQSSQELKLNWKPFPQTVNMLYVAVFERERYLYSANTSNSLAVLAAAPEARVVNSISCMFIFVAWNILWLSLCAVSAVVKQADRVTSSIAAGENFNSAEPPSLTAQKSTDWYHPSNSCVSFLTKLGNCFFVFKSFKSLYCDASLFLSFWIYVRQIALGYRLKIESMN